MRKKGQKTYEREQKKDQFDFRLFFCYINKMQKRMESVILAMSELDRKKAQERGSGLQKNYDGIVEIMSTI